ncbi:MAG: damage-inducible protein DinB [Bacteroidia bacterium]|nr:damage-inducible protein DinB [Bacteroidia bacterium]
MISTLKSQYEWVRGSREVMLDYCGTMAKGDFLKGDTLFAKGSLRNILVHAANTYLFWIGQHALGRKMVFIEPDSVGSVEDIRKVFGQVDELMLAFWEWLAAENPGMVQISLNGNQFEASPLKLFTHVTTHEFHHKGQVMALGRFLGYIPVDADIMR